MVKKKTKSTSGDTPTTPIRHSPRLIKKRLPSGEDSGGTRKKRRNDSACRSLSSMKKRRTDSDTKDSNVERDEEWERSRSGVVILASEELKKKNRHLRKYLFDGSDGSSNSEEESSHTNLNAAVKTSTESNNQFSVA